MSATGRFGRPLWGISSRPERLATGRRNWYRFNSVLMSLLYLIDSLVSAMSNSFTVPVAAKLRICQAAPKTLDLAQRLEACGASWLTLHARTVAPRRRRHGAADLSQVKRLKDNLSIPVVSNGNVRVWSDLEENLNHTGADGCMVAETLLGNPWCVPCCARTCTLTLSECLQPLRESSSGSSRHFP
jgi:tRNA-dihydrouridine synthase